jgi:hypothetical protein
VGPVLCPHCQSEGPFLSLDRDPPAPRMTDPNRAWDEIRTPKGPRPFAAGREK